jgi:hypothetical protein
MEWCIKLMKEGPVLHTWTIEQISQQIIYRYQNQKNVRLKRGTTHVERASKEDNSVNYTHGITQERWGIIPAGQPQDEIATACHTSQRSALTQF